jgi:hypothetical protein
MTIPTSNDPEAIRREIEITRENLSADVNELADTVRPGNVARRQAGKVRGAAISVKDRVMGTVSDVGSSGASTIGDAASATQQTVGQAASSAQQTVGEAASSAQQAVAQAPEVIKARAQGNPLAAGLIAFGAGWLAASLIPATRAEQTLATKARENSSVITDQVSSVAQEVGQNLKEPAQQAVESVKATASDAAATVQSEGTSAAQDVKDQSVEAKETLQRSRS